MLGTWRLRSNAFFVYLSEQMSTFSIASVFLKGAWVIFFLHCFISALTSRGQAIFTFCLGSVFIFQLSEKQVFLLFKKILFIYFYFIFSSFYSLYAIFHLHPHNQSPHCCLCLWLLSFPSFFCSILPILQPPSTPSCLPDLHLYVFLYLSLVIVSIQH